MTSSKRVVVHEDDLAMCHGANAAFTELVDLGVCTCGSVMVPCPWFLEIVEMNRERPGFDIGVHLTLTSEKRFYRWRPLTGVSRSSGLVDNDGFFWSGPPGARAHAHPEAVEAELRAQIDAAFAAGIDVTHLDGHQGTVLAPEFLDIYVRLGREYRLPILLVPSFELYDIRHNLGEIGSEGALQRAVAEARGYGSPIFDLVLETPWRRGASIQADYNALLDRVQPGLTFMALHFNTPGDVEDIEPGSAHIRIGEYDLFRSAAFRARLAADFELVGMRGFRDQLRSHANAAPTAASTRARPPL